MARKPRKGTEWEILVVKAIFALIGAVLGAIFFGFSRVVAWGLQRRKVRCHGIAWFCDRWHRRLVLGEQRTMAGLSCLLIALEPR
jgi:hypothetical protein